MKTAVAAAAARPEAAPRPVLAVIGAGRCGSALALAARRAGYTVAAVHSRTPAHAERLASRVGGRTVPTALAAVRAAEVTLVAVPDGEITRVAAVVAATGAALRGHALVHCSGARGMNTLAAARQGAARVGAVHPLQALTADAPPEHLQGTFFAVEADPGLRPLLDRLVLDLGGIPFDAPAGNRALYHAAAVLAGNATLALVARAAALLEVAGVDEAVAGDALATLLEGAARNARRLGVRTALTGPVVRDDADTVATHLQALRGDEAMRRLYHRLAVETLRTTGVVGHERVAELLGRSPRSARPAATPRVRRQPDASRLRAPRRQAA